MINDHIAKRTGDEVGGWGCTVNLKLKNMFDIFKAFLRHGSKESADYTDKNTFINFDFSNCEYLWHSH